MMRELDALTSLDPIETLADTLFGLAGDQSVRVIEAVAAALINRAREEQEEDVPAPSGLQEASGRFIGGDDQRLQLCRRIARRALRGSLTDPTRGATAFHRIETTPAWSRHVMPVAVFGSFLFYRR